jgi:transcriptional regulator with XRE-family HTH domain
MSLYYQKISRCQWVLACNLLVFWYDVDMKQKIADLRRQHKWSQRELAERLGVSTSHVTNWEQELNDPSARYLIALARVFDVDPREIVLPLAEKRGPGGYPDESR